MDFDENFLKEMGLSAMSEEEKKGFLEYIQEELEIRIGEEIAEGMTPEKIDEFQKTETDEAARDWLEKNRPDYREVVQRTIDELKKEVQRNRLQILG